MKFAFEVGVDQIQSRSRSWLLAFASFILFSLVFSFSAHADTSQPFDHSTWDTFLKKYVNEDGDVDYKGIVEDPSLLEDYRKQLAGVHVPSMGSWPRESRLALWLNAYHFGVIDIIRERYPVKSIQEIQGVWELRFIQVGKGKFSLNSIRQQQLLEVFRDEKIHAALACGAKSCPKMRPEAFVGSRVEGQLFLATQDFVNDATRNKIKPGEKKIKISRVFKWYGEDFKLDFGAFENEFGFTATEFAVLSFLTHYSQDMQIIEYLEDGNYKIRYLPFDWELNQWTRSAESV